MDDLPLPKTKYSAVAASGIYFLYLAGELVYIGKASNVLRRVGEHLHQKDFDSFSFMECEDYEIDWMEIAYIQKYKPHLNCTYVNSGCVNMANQPIDPHLSSMDPVLERNKNKLIESPLSNEYWAKRLNKPVELITKYREENGRKTTEIQNTA